MSIDHGRLALDTLLRSPHVYHQLSTARLVEESIIRGEAALSEEGALTAQTGEYTGRSPKERFLVEEPGFTDHIDWGEVNRPISSSTFHHLKQRVLDYLSSCSAVYTREAAAGADPNHRMPLTVVNEFAWHQLFARQLFLRPEEEEGEASMEGFTILSAPGVEADPDKDGTGGRAFILISFSERTILIGGTSYAGEMKKAVFSVMNELLPPEGVLPMHCSANVDDHGRSALFFGLSGTGKTTLSASPGRALIGDDEHGWSNNGIFNVEGGCYAKCIDLDPVQEPDIYQAVKFGAVLENVQLDSQGRPDYKDKSRTENTRAAYPLTFIPSAVQPSTAGHPEVILFLTADATGVLPPISRLNRSQAMYHFLSGYTSKLAGTERGVTQPEPVFSPCFGSPFLPRAPQEYASMLGEKMEQHDTAVYLVNTGWTGGPYGTGSRMKLSFTRAMVEAALAGSLSHTAVITDDIFGFDIPASCPDVPAEILQPRLMWDNTADYEKAAKKLASDFHHNFTRFRDVSTDILHGGPLYR
ncbi:phosphoenolpyruvate carboxykinase (ATP) [Alkalicoccus chagannorensis]|uniref:phosphoenolpyruvate carboxykinase (ATP) n=1 Tax=Alkalicoccus chagannorensis TaxID=427072 RepID=UPI000426E4A8|nr:phosphoenolpyruvate carboxykinase (ATP) [Alkalicoccus chagannorensis]